MIYYSSPTYNLDQYFEKGHEILPYGSNSGYKKYELIEVEVFKIIFE